jgi:hypothetical protein
MITWFIVAGLVATIALVWASRRTAARMRHHSARINDYYARALAAWVLRNDGAARAAALAAAKTAAPLQRESMLAFLDTCRPIVVQLGANDGEVRRLYETFASEVRVKDWSLSDALKARRRLALKDREYADALDAADDTVFERRYPELV